MGYFYGKKTHNNFVQQYVIEECPMEIASIENVSNEHSSMEKKSMDENLMQSESESNAKADPQSKLLEKINVFFEPKSTSHTIKLRM